MLLPDTLDVAWRNVEEGNRIDYELAESLLTEVSLGQLRKIADIARQKRVGERVYFISNYHLYYTNVCVLQCKFCAFSRNPGDTGAYTKTIEEIASELRQLDPDVSEVRVTGGINPWLDLAYYEKMLCCIKEILPGVHVEAFAPSEIDFIARKSSRSAIDVLMRLKEAGLDSLTCGGAEIFNPVLRQDVCPGKTSVESWIDISKTAHFMGLPSNASILFGHLETYSDWISHLFTLRRLQDETGGFNSFVPLCFLPQNTKLDYCRKLDFSEVLRMIAICRIVLDNFKYIKFLWLYYGKEQIKEALNFGANDLAGTANEKNKGVARSAGSASPANMGKQELVETIKKCRRLPVERGRLYEEKHVYH